MSRAFLAATLLWLSWSLSPGSVSAHPVPRRNHDRAIVVCLGFDSPEPHLVVRVHYRLEVDEFTVVFDDLPALGDKVELSKLRKPQEFYDAFTVGYAPILAANLIATLDGRPLVFSCTQRSHRLKDETGQALGHLRCDYVFEARAELAGERATSVHDFAFKEGNYELEEGLIRLSLEIDPQIQILARTEPDAALKARPLTELRPGDDARLRNATARFQVLASKPQPDSAPQANAIEPAAGLPIEPPPAPPTAC